MKFVVSTSNSQRIIASNFLYFKTKIQIFSLSLFYVGNFIYVSFKLVLINQNGCACVSGLCNFKRWLRFLSFYAKHKQLKTYTYQAGQIAQAWLPTIAPSDFLQRSLLRIIESLTCLIHMSRRQIAFRRGVISARFAHISPRHFVSKQSNKNLASKF